MFLPVTFFQRSMMLQTVMYKTLEWTTICGTSTTKTDCTHHVYSVHDILPLLFAAICAVKNAAESIYKPQCFKFRKIAQQSRFSMQVHKTAQFLQSFDQKKPKSRQTKNKQTKKLNWTNAFYMSDIRATHSWLKYSFGKFFPLSMD